MRTEGEKQIPLSFFVTKRRECRARSEWVATVGATPDGERGKRDGIRGMGKSGGDKMRSVAQQAGSGEERGKKGKRDAGASGAVEAERLAVELASERRRSKVLEDTTARVADRLDAAIESVKAILARQG